MCAKKSGNADVKAAAAQHRIIQIPQQYGGGTFQRNTHPGAQWFGKGNLGLFLHWGISSMGVDVDISWGMIANTSWDRSLYNRNKVSPALYYSFANHFNPDNYVPEKWLGAAKKAGFSYAVLTTKHHDGYTMWPSAVGEMGVRTHMGGRDLVAAYVEACRKVGLKVGLYYSPPDFYYNRKYMSFGCIDDPKKKGGWYHQPTRIPRPPKGWDNKYRKYVKKQVLELMTNYGRIDVLFFDGGPECISMAELRSLQPQMVIGPRMHGYGDCDTAECGFPREAPADWWELCERWNIGPWGYTIHDTQYKSLGWMLGRFTHARSWGGNYLINCPPDRHGEMPEVYYQRMNELAEWLKHSGESVFGIGRGPYPQQSNVPVTTKGSNWYVHVPADFKEAPKLTGIEKPSSVLVLRTGKPLKSSFAKGALTIDLPASARTDAMDVVKVSW
ncbi:MAG TPA: alpha-L-fucosidase [Phycisphaerae bacterium]|nr:alpha-L-fucosidase [Phycisphaerae bacterium]